jgi:lysyl-tRNA synthetase class 2
MIKTWQKIRNDPKLKERYLGREKVIDGIRDFFKSRGFHEVQTPILVPVPSMEPNLEPFETTLVTARGEKRRGFLIMSPEYSLKKLLAADFGNIFEITRSFRNCEEVSSTHNPEFTMLEWYRVNASYLDIMKDFEEMFIEIVKRANSNVDIKRWVYQGCSYDLSVPWERISVSEAFERFANVKEDTLLEEENLLNMAKKKGYEVRPSTTWEEVFYQIFLNEIEPHLRELRRPVFIYDYPIQQAALARKKRDNANFAERFEIFLAGLELGNCFSELIDADEQLKRLQKDFEERKRLGKNSYPIDEDFIQALRLGLPECAGIAVGIDRLVMLALDAASINEVLLFPAEEIFDL